MRPTWRNVAGTGAAIILVLVALIPGGVARAQVDPSVAVIEGSVTNDETGEFLVAFAVIVVDRGTGQPALEGDISALTFADQPGFFSITSAITGDFLVCFVSPGMRSECWDDHQVAVEAGEYEGDYITFEFGQQITGIDAALSPTTSSTPELPLTGGGIFLRSGTGILMLLIGATMAVLGQRRSR